jgi:hypothetical protein
MSRIWVPAFAGMTKSGIVFWPPHAKNAPKSPRKFFQRTFFQDRTSPAPLQGAWKRDFFGVHRGLQLCCARSFVVKLIGWGETIHANLRICGYTAV